MSEEASQDHITRCARCGDAVPGRYCPTCGLDRTPEAPLLGIADARGARDREAEWLASREEVAAPEESPDAVAPPVEPMRVVAEPGGVYPPSGGTCQRCGAAGQAGEWYCAVCGLRLQPGRFSLAREAASRSQAWEAAHPDVAAAWAAGVAIVAQQEQSEATSQETTEDGAPEAATKTCPECAEQVQAAAKVCRFCRHRFDAPAPRGWTDSSSSSSHYTGPATTSGVAVAAFVCSLAGLWFAGIPLGIYAQREIDESGGRLTGRGFATAAIVLGVLGVIATILFLLAFLSASSDVSSFEPETF